MSKTPSKVDKASKGMAGLSLKERESKGEAGTGSGSPTAAGKGRMGSGTDASPGEIAKQRRRLSIATDSKTKTHHLDGHKVAGPSVPKRASVTPAAGALCYNTFAKRSDVGIVPYNNSKVNQDRALIVTPFLDDKGQALFGVFDGHGSVGHEVSQYVIDKLPSLVQATGELLTTDTPQALAQAFVAMNDAIKASPIDATFSGTTAVCTYINGKTIWCANAGDSRAVLGRLLDGKIKSEDLSDDHKPDLPAEKARIIKAKGRVHACKGYGDEDVGPARVWLGNQDVPGLAMSRSFGDTVAQSVGVTPFPDVKKVELTPDCKFMVIASDGVWEFISSQMACEIIAKAMSTAPGDKNKGCKAACDALVKESVRLWKMEEEVVDDTTCIIVAFDD